MDLADRCHIAILPEHYLVPEAPLRRSMLRHFGSRPRDEQAETTLTWFNRWGPKKQRDNENSDCVSKRVAQEMIGFGTLGERFIWRPTTSHVSVLPHLHQGPGYSGVTEKQKQYRLRSSSPQSSGRSIH